MHIKKLLPPIVTILLLCSCDKNPLASLETYDSSETTYTLGASENTNTEPQTSTAESTSEQISEAATEQTSATAATELAFEDTPQNAYARLTASFQESGNTIYPDDYGGVYSYGKNLFVAITEDEPTEYYTSLLSEYTCVRYQTVTHSINELTEIGERAKELLDPDFGVKEVFIDVPNNRASVSITSGDPRSAQDYLKTVEDLGFTLNEVEISMAETDEAE